MDFGGRGEKGRVVESSTSEINAPVEIVRLDLYKEATELHEAMIKLGNIRVSRRDVYNSIVEFEHVGDKVLYKKPKRKKT